jgi:hypothetical protein
MTFHFITRGLNQAWIIHVGKFINKTNTVVNWSKTGMVQNWYGAKHMNSKRALYTIFNYHNKKIILKFRKLGAK